MGQMPPLSDAEKEIMKIIWAGGGSIFIAELLEKAEVQNREWKRTTVRTFIKRLMEKGYLRAQRCGKQCAYVASLSEEAYLQQQVDDFVEDVFGGSVDGMLASLFGRKALGSDELARLEAFWKKGREEVK